MIRQQIEIINKLGLHARAAAKFVSTASSFSSSIKVEYNAKKVDGKSIMSVMMLAAAKGSQIVIEAEGDDEEQALAGLVSLIECCFGEEE